MIKNAAAASFGFALAVSGTAAAAAPPCRAERLDTTLFGVALEDGSSAVARLGSDWDVSRADVELKSASFQSHDGRQTLTVFIQPDGGSDHAIAEFDLRLSRPGATHRKLYAGSLKTGRGIRLGLTKSDVIARLGTCFAATSPTPGRLSLRYRIMDADGSALLRRYNMPAYHADYEFENDRLIQFRFGLEQP